MDNNLLLKFISIYFNNLTDEQLEFFTYISQLNINNINNKYFVEGLDYLIDSKKINANLDLFWFISFEGITSINIFINEGKRRLKINNN